VEHRQSMFHGFGPDGVFDFEDEVTYLSADEVRIVDAGDSDVIYADTKRSLVNAALAVRALLEAKTMPYILGGDHAITMATVAAYSNEKPIHIVHLDAHFDFIDARNGITWGHGSPMRCASSVKSRGVLTWSGSISSRSHRPTTHPELHRCWPPEPVSISSDRSFTSARNGALARNPICNPTCFELMARAKPARAALPIDTVCRCRRRHQAELATKSRCNARLARP
jgi:Arginase family